MILMAIDHTRDFFGIPGQNPTNLATASAGLFLTRWITHFCAPVFFLLTGTGAFLSLRRRSPPELSRFLVTRGLWLLFVETILLRCLGYQFNVDFRVPLLLVLWALGWSMIVLAGAGRDSRPWVACAFGILLVAGHNLLDAVKSTESALGDSPRPGLRAQHAVPRSVRGLSAHPLGWRHRAGICDWAGLSLGGGSAAAPAPARRRWRSRLAFFVVRGSTCTAIPSPLDAAADGSLHPAVVPQRHQVSPVAVVPAHDARARAGLHVLRRRGEHVPGPRPAVVFGRVPMFYYCFTSPLIHLLAVVTCLVAERIGALDVRVAGPRPLSVQSAAGVGLGAAGGVSRMGARSRDHVSALPLVCRRQAEEDRRVAQLPLSRAGGPRVTNPVHGAIFRCRMKPRVLPDVGRRRGREHSTADVRREAKDEGHACSG